jgi:hypothetical protein
MRTDSVFNTLSSEGDQEERLSTGIQGIFYLHLRMVFRGHVEGVGEFRSGYSHETKPILA